MLETSYEQQYDLTPLDDKAILRAVRHHRRAIVALEGITFSGVSPLTSQQLLSRMRSDLRLLEHELERRGLSF